MLGRDRPDNGLIQKENHIIVLVFSNPAGDSVSGLAGYPDPAIVMPPGHKVILHPAKILDIFGTAGQ